MLIQCFLVIIEEYVPLQKRLRSYRAYAQHPNGSGIQFAALSHLLGILPKDLRPL